MFQHWGHKNGQYAIGFVPGLGGQHREETTGSAVNATGSGGKPTKRKRRFLQTAATGGTGGCRPSSQRHRTHDVDSSRINTCTTHAAGASRVDATVGTTQGTTEDDLILVNGVVVGAAHGGGWWWLVVVRKGDFARGSLWKIGNWNKKLCDVIASCQQWGSSHSLGKNYGNDVISGCLCGGGVENGTKTVSRMKRGAR
jgi:hypothetical protein